ncbi:MAG: guanylyltransferase [Blautia sp.]|nr:guanylyltransferase [Blautia sp.]
MNFDDFDKEMRQFEESLDQRILPDMYLVTRLDGRAFTKLTAKEQFQKPFDERFRDLMQETVEHLMKESGFRIVYGYTESDEISLLFHPEEDSFGRKVRKINTTLAGEASAFFSMKLGKIATFDCRVVPLPKIARVEDYFSWRCEDAHRNSLNTWCYWTLRKSGVTAHKASSILHGQGVAFKNELLFTHGINFNDLPSWQKRGIGMQFCEVEKEGFNPITREKVTTKRNVLRIDYELPLGEAYREYIRTIIARC